MGGTSKSIMAETLRKIIELSTIQDMETKICRSMCGAIGIITGYGSTLCIAMVFCILPIHYEIQFLLSLSSHFNL